MSYDGQDFSPDMSSTSVNPIKNFAISITIPRAGDFSLAWHTSRPWWHRHSPKLTSEPDD